jgi:hypothetical protein
MERKINSKIDKLEGFESVLDNFENKTMGDVISRAIENSKYQIEYIEVTDSRTGEPIEGATVQIYDDSWNYYYYPSSPNYTYSIGSDGLSEKTRIERGPYYYFNVSAPGYSSNTSDYYYTNGQIMDSYILTPLPEYMYVQLNWTNARDFDFSILSSDYDTLYKNRDIMAAPGGELFTI